MEEILVSVLGRQAYRKVLGIQEEHFSQFLEAKKTGNTNTLPMQLILCEHDPVYTLGKNGKKLNLLANASSSGAEFVETNRGGDITFHGPGQLVAYPILDLERLNMGLATYIESLEEVIIRLIANYGLKGEREKGASGVWLDTSDARKIRKICALGIRSSRYVTMHGLAFNVATDLKYFDHINPCGFTDKGVTSLEKETNRKLNMDGIVSEFIHHFSEVFQVKLLHNEVEIRE